MIVSIVLVIDCIRHFRFGSAYAASPQHKLLIVARDTSSAENAILARGGRLATPET